MVFLWSRYGEIELYKLDSVENCRNLYNKILVEIKDYEDSEFNEYLSELEEPVDTIFGYLYDIRRIIEYIIPCEVESFGFNTGFYKPKSL